jgi:hypothetical protein
MAPSRHASAPPVFLPPRSPTQPTDVLLRRSLCCTLCCLRQVPKGRRAAPRTTPSPPHAMRFAAGLEVKFRKPISRFLPTSEPNRCDYQGERGVLTIAFQIRVNVAEGTEGAAPRTDCSCWVITVRSPQESGLSEERLETKRRAFYAAVADVRTACVGCHARVKAKGSGPPAHRDPQDDAAQAHRCVRQLHGRPSCRPL